MKKTLFILLFLVGFLNAGKSKVYNDIIYLRSGEEIPCHIVEIKKNKIKFEQADVKKPHVVSVDSVSSIDIGKIREGDEWKTTNDIKDNALLNALTEKPDLVGNYVNLYLSYMVVLREDSSYSVRIRVIRKILTKSGEWGGNVRFWYPDFATARILFARSISKDGKITHIKDNAIEDASYNFSYPVYSHIRERKLAIPESRVGNILDFSFEIDYPKISEQNPFFFVLPLGGFEPTWKAMVVLKVPSNFPVKFGQKGLKDPHLVNNGTVKTITWTLEKYPGLKRERYMPPYRTLMPAVAFGTAYSWEQIASKIRMQVQKLNVPVSILDIKDPVRMYMYIQHNIEHVHAPFSSQIFTLEDGNKIIDNGYANIFDKAVLLYSALKKQGKKVKLGFIVSKDNISFTKLPRVGGSFDGYFLSDRKPSDGGFDGAFVIVDDSLFLFPNSRYTPVGYIPPKYQGALYLNIEDGSIDLVPDVPAEGESLIVERRCRVKGNDLLVTETRKFKGFAEIKERELATLKPKELLQKKEMELARMWQNAELLDFEHTDFDSINRPLTETLSYKIKDFMLNEGNLFLFRIPSFYSADSLFSPERTYNIYMAKPSYYKLSTIITTCKSLKSLYIPKGTMVQDSGYYYTYSVFKKRNGYKIEEGMRRAISEIPKKDAVTYLQCISKPITYSRRWFILKKKK